MKNMCSDKTPPIFNCDGTYGGKPIVFVGIIDSKKYSSFKEIIKPFCESSTFIQCFGSREMTFTLKLKFSTSN